MIDGKDILVVLVSMRYKYLEPDIIVLVLMRYKYLELDIVVLMCRYEV